MCAARAPRFEFPLELDVYKYTVEGLAEQEAAQAASATPAAAGPDPASGPGPNPNTGAEPTPEPARTSEGEGASAGPGPGSAGAAAAGPGPGLGSPAASRTTYVYQLKGIVVHSGTAFAGHYYSYIKVLIAMQLLPVGISVAVVYTWCRQCCCLVYLTLAVAVGVCCATGGASPNSVVGCTYTTCGSVIRELFSVSRHGHGGGRRCGSSRGRAPTRGAGSASTTAAWSPGTLPTWSATASAASRRPTTAATGTPPGPRRRAQRQPRFALCVCLLQW